MNETSDFNAIPDLNDMKAEVTHMEPGPTWSEHKKNLGVEDQEDDIPKLNVDS